MMEFKVWVEGIQRIVCGVNDTTTCQDIVLALAHAIGKSGRFSLIERWRSNERVLAPNENPFKVLMKWGEYSNDVQFILYWNENNAKCKQSPPGRISVSSAPSSPSTSSISLESSQKNIDFQNILNYSGHYSNSDLLKNNAQTKQVSLEVKESSPKRICSSESREFSSQQAKETVNLSKVYHAPPPYRDPPPPNAAVETKYKKDLLQEFDNLINKPGEPVLYNYQYKELINLVNFQKDKLSAIQADLTKFDAEIAYWEGKGRETQYQMDHINRELLNVSNLCRINQDQIQALHCVDEEHEIVRQQEKTLKSEITLLRSKLANCETELLQCRNKIRLVLEELQIEQRAHVRRNESQRQVERSLIIEVERLQREIESAKQSTDMHHVTAEQLKKEVSSLEAAIIEKKKQVETLVCDMKEANLQSLTIAPADEIKHLLEGPSKAGTTRKMIGSPRQLENAVPTNKNPHGVWV